MEQKVVDVSYHNGRVDWERVKAAGYHAILRCGYGQDKTSQDDKQWERNYSECERLGIPYGVYFYSYAKGGGEVNGEIAHCLRLIRGRKLSYPVYFDTEQRGTEAYARANAVDFCTAMENAGYWAGIYAGDAWWTDHLRGLEDRWTPWVARYGKAPVNSCDMWQFAEKGYRVPGVSGNIDVNVCYRPFPAEIAGGGATTTSEGDIVTDEDIQKIAEAAAGKVAGELWQTALLITPTHGGEPFMGVAFYDGHALHGLDQQDQPTAIQKVYAEMGQDVKSIYMEDNWFYRFATAVGCTDEGIMAKVREFFPNENR